MTSPTASPPLTPPSSPPPFKKEPEESPSVVAATETVFAKLRNAYRRVQSESGLPREVPKTSEELLAEAMCLETERVAFALVCGSKGMYTNPNTLFMQMVEKGWWGTATHFAAQELFLSKDEVLKCINKAWYLVINTLFTMNPRFFNDCAFYLEMMDNVDGEIAAFFKEYVNGKEKFAQLEEAFLYQNYAEIKRYLADPYNPVFKPDQMCALAIECNQAEIARKLAMRTTGQFSNIEALDKAVANGYRGVEEALYRYNPRLKMQYEGWRLDRGPTSAFDFEETKEEAFWMSPPPPSPPPLPASDENPFGTENEMDAIINYLYEDTVPNAHNLKRAARAFGWLELEALLESKINPET